MIQGARTPEELEALLEDAFVLRDVEALCEMFAEGAILAIGDGVKTARGSEEIGRLVPALWAGDGTYVAEPRRVVQAHDLALVLATHGTSVVRRGADGAWRYAISLVEIDQQTKEEQ